MPKARLTSDEFDLYVRTLAVEWHRLEHLLTGGNVEWTDSPASRLSKMFNRLRSYLLDSAATTQALRPPFRTAPVQRQEGRTGEVA